MGPVELLLMGATPVVLLVGVAILLALNGYTGYSITLVAVGVAAAVNLA